MLTCRMQHVTFRPVTNVVSPIQRGVDLNDQVYEYLKERLLTREIGPGQKLRLQSLADQLGVSRSPIHHALTRLMTEGLVDQDYRGYFARAITHDLILGAHDTRCAIELFAADQTVGQLNQAQLARLRSLLDRTAVLVEEHRFVDKREYMLANEAFHEYLVELAGNDVLLATYRSLNVHRLMERALGGDASDAGPSTEGHGAIVRAYEAGDVLAARAAIAANIETGKRIALQALADEGGIL
jgi:DNA-binding GntR family transcriptional regulator